MIVTSDPLEFPVLQKETLNKWYSLKAYHVAKTLSDIPFAVRDFSIPFRSPSLHMLIARVICLQALCTSVYLVITYFMTAQPMDADRFFKYLALGVYVSLISQTLGFLIGTIFPIEVSLHLLLVLVHISLL